MLHSEKFEMYLRDKFRGDNVRVVRSDKSTMVRIDLIRYSRKWKCMLRCEMMVSYDCVGDNDQWELAAQMLEDETDAMERAGPHAN